MKLTSVKYLTGNGFKNIWANKLMSAASIGVLVACMSVIGLAVAISANVDNAISELEKENVVMAYFDDKSHAIYENSNDKKTENDAATSVTEDDYVVKSYADAILICDKIRDLENVRSVVFITSEMALKEARDSLPEDQREAFDALGESEFGNLFSCSAKITMINLEKFSETIEEIEAMQGVARTSSAQDIAKKMVAIEKAINIVGFWIIAILMIISIVIVSNTIRVTMYNRKLEISIMKAVGATDSFVRLPFIVEGITIGTASACITVIILYFVYNAVKGTVKAELGLANVVPFSDFFWTVFGLFIGIGCLAGLLSSAFMINKYLRKEGSEFRAL